MSLINLYPPQLNAVGGELPDPWGCVRSFKAQELEESTSPAFRDLQFAWYPGDACMWVSVCVPAYMLMSPTRARVRKEERLEGEGSLKNPQKAHESRLDVTPAKEHNFQESINFADPLFSSHPWSSTRLFCRNRISNG